MCIASIFKQSGVHAGFFKDASGRGKISLFLILSFPSWSPVLALGPDKTT
ncbi:hypothetical protein EV682_10353 [Iodobacter fluviatilis]|uniref:Uncharacterized protein n=1 Tax=Iodobacter fluviatilis TaxID=537 RepID=A0A377QA44_9NEIS|nr:hypothetical protein EV682_10353 [Iodobacter fluviatilis]STQ91459.1 Uncharacterised protein [Iodobacter fluviatilis]